LVRIAAKQTDRVITTLFVNPTQFAPHEDLATYPRDEKTDIALCAASGADLMFAPSISEIYPDGHATKIEVEGLGQILEGEFRPQFFIGVATVIAKLLLQALPDIAVFGEKDYQQLCVIRRMVTDLNIPVEIVSAPTVRDADGVAMSSRNSYMSVVERAIAPVLFEVITGAAKALRASADPHQQCRCAETQLTEAGFSAVDYVSARDAVTLEPVHNALRPARVLAAAWLGKTRLIDNVAV
jgi:pantoate--beta-alanine ligase